jgi:hypothetical protein
LSDPLSLVALPGRAVGEQCGGIYLGGHLGQPALGELEVGQGLPEHGPGGVPPQGLVQGPAGKAQCGGGYRGAEDIQGLHGHLEALSFLPQPTVDRNPAIPEAQRGQRVRRDDLEALGDFQTRRVCVHHKSTHALRTLAARRAGEDHIEVGNAAVGNPGFLPVEHISVALEADFGGHGPHIGAGIRLGEGKCRDELALGHPGQVVALLLGRAVQGNGPGAQALHGEGEVGQAVVIGQGLADQADRGGVNGVEYPAESPPPDGVARPAALSQQPHQLAAGAVHVGLFASGQVSRCPGLQLVGQRAVPGLEKGPVEVGVIAHRRSPLAPRFVRVLAPSLPQKEGGNQNKPPRRDSS